MKWVLGFLIIVLLALAIFEPSYGWRVRQLLTPHGAALSADDPSLIAQNESLKAELAKLQGVAAQLPQASKGYTRAMVYSRYPLNFQNAILIDAGTDQGVAVGKAVVFQGVLIGIVQKVFSGSALVQTVFDSNFKMPVRVNAGGYDGLLVGGPYPKVESITKKAVLQNGDIIYAATAGLPYGLPVGEVDATSTSPDNLFEESSIGFAYDINNIQTVLIAQ